MADVKELQKVADEQTRKDLGPASVPAEASVEILDKPIKVVLECSVCWLLQALRRSVQGGKRVKRFITLYRPTYVTGVRNNVVVYRCGDLRAKVFGIRVPILWALDRVLR